MVSARIMIVEDENIVAKDIQNTLKRLGYTVPAVVSTGEEAVEKASELRPDLVLMDIRLKGQMNGIEAADQIRSDFDTPVVYLTAYADEQTLQQAKITEPFGYIIKPFELKGLHSTIEMALYKHRMEKKLKESEKWLSTILNSINDGVIATDIRGDVAFMNPVSEFLTGWEEEKAIGRPLKYVFNILDEENLKPVNWPISEALPEGFVSGSASHILTGGNGMKIPIDDSIAPIKDEKERILGGVLVFRDVTERKKAERLLKQHVEDLERSNMELKLALKNLLKRVDKSHALVSEQDIKAKTENLGGVFLYPLQEKARVRSIFVSIVDVKIPTLAVVRTPPARFKETLGRNVETVWLTTNQVPEMVCVNPLNISRLSTILLEFLEHAPEGVILFEGVEYLLSIVGFNDLLGLIQLLNDKVARCEGAIYMVLDMDVLDKKEAKHLQRECNIYRLSGPKWSRKDGTHINNSCEHEPGPFLLKPP